MSKISCLILLLLVSYAQYAASWNDTCTISNAHITTDVKSKEILGVKIEFDSYLAYDRKHVKAEPEVLIIDLSVLNAFGKQVGVKGISHSFNQKGFAGADKSEMLVNVRKKNTNTFFIPYYCLDLPPGQSDLQYSIRISVKDTSILQNPRVLPISGISSQNFSIHKPPVIKVRMLCTGVRVSATDHGKQWDFGLSGLPDPVFKVILDNEVQPDFLYVSAEVQNSLSAAWIDPSPVFLISEGDQITLGIYDKDTLIDDLIGKQTHSLEEWIEITKANKELVFDQVTYCTVKIEKIP